MSATPEQIAVELDDLAEIVRGELPSHLYVDDLRAAAALIRAQAERVSVFERLAERIAGEAPFKEPSGSPSVAWPPNWSEDMRDTVNDMIIDAFADGYARALWEMGQIADATLKGAA